MNNVVISIGGSVLVPKENDAEYTKSLAALLKEVSATHRL